MIRVQKEKITSSVPSAVTKVGGVLVSFVPSQRADFVNCLCIDSHQQSKRIKIQQRIKRIVQKAVHCAQARKSEEPVMQFGMIAIHKKQILYDSGLPG